MAELSPILQALYEGRRAAAEAAAQAAELDVFEATALGRTDRLFELIEEDPSRVNSYSPDGFRALHLGAFFAQPAAVDLLLDHGAEADCPAQNALLVTPLHSAAAAAQREIAAALLDRGANPNARQQGGFTPLHAAAQNGDSVLVELLLGRGGDGSSTTDEGKTAAEYAREAGHADLARRLEE